MALSLCSASVDNTGEIACDKSRGVLKKLFIFNGNIEAADYVSTDALFDKLVENSKLSKDDADKIFVLNEVQDLADTSEANKEGSLNLGFKTVLLEGKPAYTAKFFGGSDMLKRLRTFNNQTIRVLEYDADGVVWGTKSGTNFKGFQAKLFFTGNKISTGQNVEQGVVTVTVSILSASEYFDNAYWAETEGNIEDIVPLIDAPLAYVSHVSNALKYSVKVPGSNLTSEYNVLGDYGAEIAALTFTAKSGASATNPTTTLAITSVAYDSTNNLLTVTYDSTAYTAVTGGHYIKLIPPTPADLDAGDVTNLELLPVTHVKPA